MSTATKATDQTCARLIDHESSTPTIDLAIDDLMAIYTGVQFGYFDFLAVNGQSTAAELAEFSGCSQHAATEWLERQVDTRTVERIAAAGGSRDHHYCLLRFRAELLVELQNPFDA